MTSRSVAPRWQPSGMQRSLVTAAAVSMLAALVTGRPELVLVAAPLIGALLAGVLHRAPEALTLRWECEATRVQEGDRVEVLVTSSQPMGRLAGTLQLADMPHRLGFEADPRCARWVITPRRWGHWSIGPVQLRITDPTGLHEAALALPLPGLTVYPASPALSLLPDTDRLARQLGEHVGDVLGRGAEFAAVRRFVPGDPARHINWAVSSRRGELYVNQRWAERAVDVVVAIDTFSDVGPPGRRTLDVAVRGAAATAAGYLRHHDRVGVVVLGGVLRWVTPGSSARQLHRILDTVLELPGWQSVVDPDVSRIPRQVLPPGAWVVVFSPLLDPRAVHAVTDLRQRGFAVLVIDVLTCQPSVGGMGLDQLSMRLWRLDRLALAHELGELGALVLPWDDTEPLDLVLGPLQRRTAGARQ